MLRRKFKVEKVPEEVKDVEDSDVEPEEKIPTKKRKAVDDDKGHDLETLVFGAEKEAWEGLGHFVDTLKRPKTSSSLTEKTAKWEDEDGIAATKLLMQPSWATAEELNVDAADSDDDVMKGTGNYLAPSVDLPSDIIDIKKCTNANKENPSKGKIKSVEFLHNAELMLVAGMDSKLRLFQVDGKCNPKIESIGFDNFPIFKAHFTKDGEQVIVGSWHKSFYVFDMMSGKMTRTCIKEIEYAPNTKNFVMSPDGKHMCLVGQYGHLHLLSVKTRELVHTFRMNSSAEAVCFNSDGQSLLSHGDGGEVFIWDVKSRTCRHKFIDEGCTKGTSLSVSYGDHYVATGSYSGVVNIYDDSCFQKTSPKPRKAVMNLTTSCSTMAFNSTAEILAIASDFTESAMKLVHLPTQTVFSNFPKKTDGLHIPMALDFSPNSGYLSVGNNKGKALLYRLRHYSEY